MMNARETFLAVAGRRAAPLLLVPAAAGTLAGAATAQATESAIHSEIEFARGLAVEWQYVDLAEEVLLALERKGGLPEELAAELGLVKCEIYAEGARREGDPDKRDQLYSKAVDAFRQYLDQNPRSAVIGEAQRGYVDVSNQYAQSLAKRSDEAVGDEATALREQINAVLEEALKYTSDLKDGLRGDGTDWPAEQKVEWARVMYARGQMYHTLARISDEGAFFYSQAESTLEELASRVGEKTPQGLMAYLELADVYLSQGSPQDAVDFAEFVVATVLPVEDELKAQWDELTAEEKQRFWIFAELGLETLVEAQMAAGRTADAVEWSLHFYNTWRREGFVLSPNGYVSLLAVARALLDAGGFVGGSLTAGDLRWFATAEEMEAATARRDRRNALDLALSIAQTVNQDNRGNVLQVRAQKLTSEVIARPGVQVSPAVLFEAAQGELNNGAPREAVHAFQRVMRSLEGQDQAARAEFGAKVSFYLGESFRKQDRMLEAAMAYREGATTFAGDPEFDEKNANNFYKAASEVRTKYPSSKPLEDLRSEAERVVLNLGGQNTDEITLRNAKKLYDQEQFAEARAKFLEVPVGSDVREKAITYAALCLRKMKDNEGAEKELLDYVNTYVTDATKQVTTPTAVATRKEALGMASYYLATIAFEAANKGKRTYDEALERLDGYYERFPNQTDYAAVALYMETLAHLGKLDLAAVRQTHAQMVEVFPEDKFTGAAAKAVYNALLAERDKQAQQGAAERARELTREMADYLRIGNRLDSNPSFENLRAESRLWIDLGESTEAERVLRDIVRRYGDDAKSRADLDRYVLPDLGQVLLAQKRVEEAFQVLDPLVPPPDAKDDARKPSSSVVDLWCRSVAGWVEKDADGQLVQVPGVGGNEKLAAAASYRGKLTDQVKAKDGNWQHTWYVAYFEQVYAYYQWSQVDSSRLDGTKKQLDLLKTELTPPNGEPFERIEDADLRARFQWLSRKIG